MKIVALIPARYEASRFPGKLLQNLHGKSVLWRTYERVLSMNLFDEVIAVCDDDRLIHEITQHGGQAIKSTRPFESGTDRIAAVAVNMDADIIINVQADEPFIAYESLQALIQLFESEHIHIGSLVMPITDVAQINNPNCVKVVLNHQHKALYFSRSPIPFVRDASAPVVFYKHIGVYAFRKQSLLHWASLPPSSLENVEKLENLRMLENGLDIYMAIVQDNGISIDTPDDLSAAQHYLANNPTQI